MDRAPRSRLAVPLRRRTRPRPTALVALALLGAAPALAGQSVAAPPLTPDSTVATAPRSGGGVTPGGAFLRSVLVPGWGHAAIGSHHRGAFYVVAEGATAWTLLKTRRRYAEAEDRIRFQEGILRADLAREGVTEEAEVQARLDEDPTLQDLRDLREARRQQREDWTALGIFMVLLAGVDAFVSAHLKDFPAPLELDARPAGNGRVDFSVGITLPR